MLFKEISFSQILFLMLVYWVGIYLKLKLERVFLVPVNPIETYGYFYSLSNYFFRTISLIVILPVSLYSIFGTLLCHKENQKTENQAHLSLDTKLCIRVVTRGMFPELIKSNLEKHKNLLKPFKTLQYTYEIITDVPLGLDKNTECYELVVPKEYETKTGAKFKGRALQYAIELNASNLTDDDWVLHLDEESLLTKSSIEGIIEFMAKNKHPIGQGLVAYGKCGIVHWLNTLADNMRSSTDIGALRLSLKFFNIPGYNFKGSYIVCKNRVETTVSYDHGLESSIAEDAFFAIKATNLGFTFDWIRGEVLEQSPFTFMDFLRQRRRWCQGLYLMAISNNLKADFTCLFFRWKFYSSVLTPVLSITSLCQQFYPVSFFSFDRYLGNLHEVGMWYLFWVGMRKSMNLRELSWSEKLLYVIGVPLWVRYWDIAGSIAIVWALSTAKKNFDIVKKSFEVEKNKNI